jgi:tRNA pseudouridine55 synthase
MENEKLSDELKAGKVLLFNKPLCWTSFDLVNKVKSILKHQLLLKKIKVGHAGTLDPLATGLVIICTGKETVNIEKIQAEPKEYLAKIKLGATTPSFDLETDIDRVYSVDHIQITDIVNVMNSFIGEQMQVPPVFSAKFVNGTRAYQFARKGVSVELNPNKISIYSIAMIQYDSTVIEVSIKCSKGTYIRALARDIGLSLGSGAHLISLVRTGIGKHSLKDAINIEEFERNLVFM